MSFGSQVRDYLDNVNEAVGSIFEGMAVTMSWMFRKPSTIQYPFHPSAPDVPIGGPDSLPERYRGFLEVDMDICTACLACERACPIDCIRIDVEKKKMGEEQKEIRVLTRFDIDMAKCMYCGLCSEPCPTDAIRHTRHFEASVANLEHLCVRFVDPGDPLAPFKVKKGEDYDTVDYGSIAQQLYVDRQWDLPAIDFPSIPRKSSGKKKKEPPPNIYEFKATDRAVQAKGIDKTALAKLLEEAMAGTDCGACLYPTCKEYSEAIAKGECSETFRCEPGGKDSQVEAGQIFAIWQGEDPNKFGDPEVAKAHAAAVAAAEGGGEGDAKQ